MKSLTLMFLCLFTHGAVMACANRIPLRDLSGLRADIRAVEEKFIMQINQAVDWIFQGESVKAIKLLQAIEQERPGRYETATNLGAAYELNGQLAEALHWIRRGIELNPEAHDGTEWLHYEILHAKDQVAANANWLQTHSVIDPATQDLDKTIKALQYQLAERSQLVKPPNDIVADLYYLLGLLQHRNDNAFLRDEAFKN
ncbi:hypothetical protein [Marinicella meishanensis]|uniref:hypothetical protein n=1 Tax=Marinicella meishanensis TaxID=2873263 RepID=UPI001CBE3FBB|nr:hypothetical protein [Marinicella sp. NBU2979]